MFAQRAFSVLEFAQFKKARSVVIVCWHGHLDCMYGILTSTYLYMEEMLFVRHY